jgi:hypothetical protein
MSFNRALWKKVCSFGIQRERIVAKLPTPKSINFLKKPVIAWVFKKSPSFFFFGTRSFLAVRVLVLTVMGVKMAAVVSV